MTRVPLLYYRDTSSSFLPDFLQLLSLDLPIRAGSGQAHRRHEGRLFHISDKTVLF